MLDATPANTSLSEFLSRPVRISTYTWAESDAIGTLTSIEPWHLFFNDARIKYKLNNYSFIQCDLKVKILINASPFYYGATLVSYEPLPNLAMSYTSITRDAGTRYFIPYSQRPHLWIYPQNNEGGEMVLPFFLNKNWLRVQHYDDFKKMGKLSFMNVTALASANGATGAGVTIQVYAWAENVKLAGPSTGLGLAVQTRDEYDGPVSRAASAVAEAAGSLRKIPMISHFATASEMGARAVAAGAHALGFTNTPVISDVQPFRPAAAPPLATSEISYPVEKLTMDPKNELTIDPAIAGLNSLDELSLKHIVQKESYLTTATFSTTNVVDDILFSSVVTPMMFAVEPVAQLKIFMTPVCWISYLFAHWRGDMIFRFRFVASQYHKGRVRISYDPSGYSGENIIADAQSTSVVFTQIVDLGKDTDVEIRVPYQQALAWLQSGTRYPITGWEPWSTSASPTFSHDDTKHNGTIVMRCLTQLTAPVTSSSIPIMVFVRGADNLEFANPTNLLEETSTIFSYLPPQTQDMYDSGEQQIIAGGMIHPPAPERFLVNFGEAVTSLRQYLRRSTLVGVRPITADTTHPHALWYRLMTKWPPHPGYDASGFDVADKIVTIGTTMGYNYTNFHPIQYIAPAFVGTRGSVMWHFNLENTGPLEHIRVVRTPYLNATPREYVMSSPVVNSSKFARFYRSTEAGTGGQALTNQITQAGISVSMPNYSAYKFQSTAPGNATFASSADGTGYDACLVEVAANGLAGPAPGNGKLWMYASIGTDYQLLFFLNVPTMFAYSANPTTP